jgi:hypothetical protein
MPHGGDWRQSGILELARQGATVVFQDRCPDDVPGDSVWRLAGSDFRTEGKRAVLRWQGRYGKDFEGGFEIRMDDAGDVAPAAAMAMTIFLAATIVRTLYLLVVRGMLTRTQAWRTR